jgi:hypothetical protein
METDFQGNAMRKMNKFFAAFAGFWRERRISIIVVALLIIGIVFAGLHDVGIVLGYLAATVIFVEITRRWRKIRNFVILFFTSILGMVFLSFLHEEVAVPLVSMLLGPGALESTGFRIFSDAVSLVILFFGPAGSFVGFTGALALGVIHLISSRKKPKTEADA